MSPARELVLGRRPVDGDEGSERLERPLEMSERLLHDDEVCGAQVVSPRRLPQPTGLDEGRVGFGIVRNADGFGEEHLPGHTDLLVRRAVAVDPPVFQAEPACIREVGVSRRFEDGSQEHLRLSEGDLRVGAAVRREEEEHDDHEDQEGESSVLPEVLGEAGDLAV
ncbi:MAG: hypothetical protein UY95_C0027G0002 [Parcubacteria group bacterium GW2011_GWA2_56_7]|nr:MAG: hypothetical protein UY95_C0027G0002 [Parcubacteria group bacterium GW2011_GWA2_56_7]